MRKSTVGLKVTDKRSAKVYLKRVVQSWVSLHYTHPRLIKALMLLLDL